jgi:hypothetical protein
MSGGHSIRNRDRGPNSYRRYNNGMQRSADTTALIFLQRLFAPAYARRSAAYTMTRISVTIALLLMPWDLPAQDNRTVTLYRGPDSNHVSIKGIRHVTKSSALKTRPGIEVAVDEPASDARAALE